MTGTARVFLGSQEISKQEATPQGRLVERAGEAFYRIEHAQAMAPFLASVVSDADHWLFVGSNGALTAGRQSSKFALFPYTTEDKLLESAELSGPYTALIVERDGQKRLWRPFTDQSELVYGPTRSLEKSVLGNKLRFEELNQALGVRFSYEWKTSAEFGFVRECTLENTGSSAVEVRLLDGLQNLLAADIDEQMQLGFSCLLDAYKQSEAVPGTRLGLYMLTAQVIDRAEPRESLHCTTVWSHGLPGAQLLLSSGQHRRFLQGSSVAAESEVRGQRGAYLLHATLAVQPGARLSWLTVADVRQSQAKVSQLLARLNDPARLVSEVHEDVDRGTQNLRRILAATDGFQMTGDPLTCAHHVANVLFNDLRGGVYAQGYLIPGADFARFVRAWNRPAASRSAELLKELPATLTRSELFALVEPLADPDLTRLAYEYLPLTFSRRHGDPSRPWNRFEIRVRDQAGQKLLGFQGNWRDIFQNWEALSVSHPDFVENIIVKFVNASTADGYNPYRITQEGIDWEVPEPDHPWAAIGYWGDHQIIYLTKLLELSRSHHPERLPALLERELFTYADVPYVIKPYAEIVKNVRDTIVFDHAKQARVERRVEQLGADGKLLGDRHGLTRVNLTEKLWVAALGKLGNFVPGGGLWLNTGRPEWNDANNALVGYGLSMVTTYYLERYLTLLLELMKPLAEREICMSAEVVLWLERTAAALESHANLLGAPTIDDQARRRLMDALGGAASDYRTTLYAQGLPHKASIRGERLLEAAGLARRWVRHTIATSQRADGLYHAYNLLSFKADGGVAIEHLYEMLEGQVAALSTRALPEPEAQGVLNALAESRMYRADQASYTLYPDRRLPRFLEKNRIGPLELEKSALLSQLLAEGDERVVFRDAQGVPRFQAGLANSERLATALGELVAASDHAATSPAAIEAALAVYEATFAHRSFTGRSGTMFAYEGLGSIYWHMVAKLLLAVAERTFAAAERGAPNEAVAQLKRQYYAVRRGLGGFNKTPADYGAFPLDPYSHTPQGAGARQPGMTGQVKEEVLTRLYELGVRVSDGRVSFRPILLRKSEFLREPAALATFDLAGAPLLVPLPTGSLGFSYCQVPVVFHASDESRIAVTEGARVSELVGDTLSSGVSAALFARTGRVRRIDVWTRPGC